MLQKDSAEKPVRDIGGKTRRKFSAKAKIRIALEGLHEEESRASLCSCEDIGVDLYYKMEQGDAPFCRLGNRSGVDCCRSSHQR
jgi:hypothetical protein